MGGDCFNTSGLAEALIIGLVLLACAGAGLGALIGVVFAASGRKPRGALIGGIIGAVVGPIALILIWFMLVQFWN